jgi:hypothetical protein
LNFGVKVGALVVWSDSSKNHILERERENGSEGGRTMVVGILSESEEELDEEERMVEGENERLRRTFMNIPRHSQFSSFFFFFFLGINAFLVLLV